MTISKKILNYLNKNKVAHEILKHKTVYTAFDLANTLAEKLNKVAKTLVVKVDKDYRLVVLPANVRLDTNKLKKILKAKVAEIVPEKTMEKVFKIKNGTITPFGALHEVEVMIDKGLARAKDIIVRAGSLTEALRLQVKDLHKLEKATLGDFSETVKKAAAKAVKKAKQVSKKKRT